MVVPGTRPATGSYAREQGLQVACPLIVKQRERKPERNAFKALLTEHKQLWMQPKKLVKTMWLESLWQTWNP